MSTHICPLCVQEHTHTPPLGVEETLPDVDETPEVPVDILEPVDPPTPPPEKSWGRGVEWLELTDSGWAPMPSGPEIDIETIVNLKEPWPYGLFKQDSSGDWWRWNGDEWELATTPEPIIEEPSIEAIEDIPTEEVQ